MRYRHISIIPSYLMIIVVMVIIGVLASSIVAHVFLPLGKQKAYFKADIDYTVDIGDGKVVVQVVNRKTYDVKIDVILVTMDNRVLTACPSGYIESRKTNSSFPLLGLEVKGREVLTIVCFVDNIKDVRVYGYGVSSGSKREKAYIGYLPGIYLSGGTYDIDVWRSSILYFRIPITVITTRTYEPAYIAVELSPHTLPSSIWSFIRTHTRPDLNDVLVVGVNGEKYPTKPVRYGDKSITVYFKVDKLEPGIHRFYLYFGNPYLDKPLYPLEDVNYVKLIRTPNELPRIIYYSMAYPAYLVPEAKWLPEDEELEFGLLYTRYEWDFDEYIDIILKEKKVKVVRELIDKALDNKVAFPVGTKEYFTYSYSKTDLKWAPWGIVVVVPLPRLQIIPSLAGIRGVLWVASDDGSGAYIIALNENNVYRKKIYWNVYKGHGAWYWNYPSKTVIIDVEKVENSDTYLVIFAQNGICGWDDRWRCGWGPGYLDFRFVLWYVEQMDENPPPPEEFAKLRQSKYIDVIVYGIGRELHDYALPVDLTNRDDVDWGLFIPDTVYVVSSSGEPLYYWLQIEDKVIVWVKIPYLPARGYYKFRIYYGGVNKYPDYHDPTKVFSFFDDFSCDPGETDNWNIYPSTPKIYRWDRENKVLYLIHRRYGSGIALFMNLDWRKNFHVHFKAYVHGEADGLTFFFFKDEEPYKKYKRPTSGGSLALSTGVEGSKGYAIEIDIYDNGRRDPRTPHIALVETFSSPNVAFNKHYAYRRYQYMDKWVDVDIYYYNKMIEVKINGRTVIRYKGGIFYKYGVKYGGIGFTAATGGLTGVFAIDDVFLRYYPGREPTIRIIGTGG